MTKLVEEKMLVEENVKARYSEGAQEKQEALCCPVNYQADLLAILPQEIIDKDYGCGDPSRYVREGDVVLDLGSGGGKVCYMAAKIVGERGHVHGVDMTDDMLALARKYQHHMAEKIGSDRVSFHKGYIQNLAFDLEAAAEYVEQHPLNSMEAIEKYERWKVNQAKNKPLIANDSISLVISNCVLNLVDHHHRRQMLSEIYRVLKPGGRVAISDIISDEYVPLELQNDPQLWSGCISGAFQEEEFLQAFADQGFTDIAYDKWDKVPWQVVKGIEFRSATLVAQKPLPIDVNEAPCKALMYLGPHKRIEDDMGNRFLRGKRTLVPQHVHDSILGSDLAEKFVGFAVSDASRVNQAGYASVTVPASLSKNNEKAASADGKCCG